MPIPYECNGNVAAGTPLFEAFIALNEAVSERMQKPDFPELLATTAVDLHASAAWAIPLDSGHRLIVSPVGVDYKRLHVKPDEILDPATVLFWDVDLQPPGNWLPYGAGTGISYVLTGPEQSEVLPSLSMPDSVKPEHLFDQTGTESPAELRSFIVESIGRNQSTLLYSMFDCALSAYHQLGVFSVSTFLKSDKPDGDASEQILQEISLSAQSARSLGNRAFNLGVTAIAEITGGSDVQQWEIKTSDTRGPFQVETITPALIQQWGGVALRLEDIEIETLREFGLDILLDISAND
ncbi:MAG TPA: hypothetical protein VLG47_01220 [Candidatus Saccharimonadales bacterium]|nr:hypothetical protein [Candidatus Saccharimonadales bacterium]